MVNMEQVLEKSKEFEQISLKHDPMYDDLVKAIQIVTDFIKEFNLIVYGGSAIDYALRLKGDKIYPDESLTVPDLDFFSPTSFEHAYTLADRLYAAGFKSARVIQAIFVTTMRVDCGDNHFVADISYIPPSVFGKIPFVVYNGMRIVHPEFQKIDLHASFTFPFDKTPREVIFERWNKDVKRFNLLNKYYPTIGSIDAQKLHKVVVKDLNKFVLHGYAAYAAIYSWFAGLLRSKGVEPPANVDANPLHATDNSFAFDTLNTVEIVHFNPPKAVKELGLKNVKHYEPLINLIPEHYIGDVRDLTYEIHSTKHKLLAVNSFEISGHKVRVANVQYLLRHFLARAVVSEGKIKNTYLNTYLSLLNMIPVVEKIISREEARKCPLFPSINTYGSDNFSSSYEVALNRFLHDWKGDKLMDMPRGYYPERGGAHPVFDPESSEYFREAGREIKGGSEDQ